MSCALRQVERGDDPAALEPLVHAELLADVLALEDEELRVELLLQLALPLEGEVRGADDQDALGEPAQLEFADEQARHDGLARAGVVGQQEAHARELEQVVVDRFELMRQRIDARDREPEVGIELVGDAERVGLEAKPQQASVAVERVLRVENREAIEIGRCQRDLAEPLGLRPHQADHPARRAVGLHGLDPHRLVEERAGEDLARADGRQASHRAGPPIRRNPSQLIFLPTSTLPSGDDTEMVRIYFLSNLLNAGKISLSVFPSICWICSISQLFI